VAGHFRACGTFQLSLSPTYGHGFAIQLDVQPLF
jgi:hypothetical protein